jgi:hypothetical protein
LSDVILLGVLTFVMFAGSALLGLTTFWGINWVAQKDFERDQKRRKG